MWPEANVAEERLGAALEGRVQNSLLGMRFERRYANRKSIHKLPLNGYIVLSTTTHDGAGAGPSRIHIRRAMSFPKSDYKEYPKTLDRADLWGQVRRTVNGMPVSDEQIAMIVRAIRSGLQLSADDSVLDLACGNGALSSYLLDECATLFGVDSSSYLIEIANSRFAAPDRTMFVADDAAHYVENAPDAGRFTKVLCYGSFSFFSEIDAVRVLRGLNRRFINVNRVFIGNLPDRDRAHRFYPPGKDYGPELKDHSAQIGIWRSEAELRALTSMTGWRLEVAVMPTDYYAAHYRFDAILTR